MRRLRLPLALALAVAAGACGDDEPRNPVRARSSAPPRPAPTAPAAAAQAGVDLSQVPAKYRTLDWTAEDELNRMVRDTRDPFQHFVDPVALKSESDELRPDIVGGIPFEVNELQLDAIITGTAIHKALMVDPRGVGHVVRAGDIVGRAEPKRITRITRNEVVFRPLVVKPDGPMAETVKRLLTDEELSQLEEL